MPGVPRTQPGAASGEWRVDSVQRAIRRTVGVIEIEKSETIAKLTAVYKALMRLLKDPTSRYFDPPVVLEFFSKWGPIRDALRRHYPSLLGDLADRDTPSSSGTTDYDGRGYIEREPIDQLYSDMQYVLDVLAALPVVNVPSMKVTREGLFFAGQYFDALRELGELIAQAENSLILIDGYISNDTLKILSGKKAKVRVKILTNAVKGPLQVSAQAFKKQFGNLEIKTSNSFHDRFLIIDEKEFYHFGASIKDLGHRGFMFSRIEEPDVTAALHNKFIQEWNSAPSVV